VAATPSVRGVEPSSFLMAAAFTFVGYFLFWVPGLILNVYFLDGARRAKRETGREPAGLGVLRALLILFVYVPLAVVGALTMLVLVGSLIAHAVS